MNKTNTTIDRLGIRLRGVSPQVACSLVSGLGNELQRQLAKQPGLLKEKSSINIGKIDSGTLKTGRGTSSSDLRSTIAGRVAGAITSKIKYRAGA